MTSLWSAQVCNKFKFIFQRKHQFSKTSIKHLFSSIHGWLEWFIEIYTPRTCINATNFMCVIFVGTFTKNISHTKTQILGEILFSEQQQLNRKIKSKYNGSTILQQWMKTKVLLEITQKCYTLSMMMFLWNRFKNYAINLASLIRVHFCTCHSNLDPTPDHHILVLVYGLVCPIAQTLRCSVTHIEANC